MNQENTLILSLKDFFTAEMLKYSLLPFIITMVIMYALFFYIAGVGLDQLGTLTVHSTTATVENGVPNVDTVSAVLQGSSIIKFLMSSAITSWIATFLVYTIGSLLILYVSIFVAILVIGFLTPYVLKVLHKKHYQDVDMVGFSNPFESLFLVLKWMFIMLLLFVVFVPLYFVPILNVIAFNFPLYYFFHKMLTFDVSSNICTREEDKKIKFFSANSIRLKTLLLYLVSLIPFAVFFGSIFYVIYIGHAYFLELRKLRTNDGLDNLYKNKKFYNEAIEE